MTTDKKTAPKAAQGVHTSAQSKPEKPESHKPSKPHPVDEHHGKAGSFVFDPETGKRTPVVLATGADDAAPAADQPAE